MRIAIIYPPIRRQGAWPHLGQNRQFRFSFSDVKIYPMVPASAATLLKKEGFTVLFLDGINLRLTLKDFEKRLADFSPDLVVIETKTPIIIFHWRYINKLKKKNPKVLVALVGDHITALPSESFENCQVDFCLTGGDWDLGLLSLANFLARKKDKLTGGIFWREGKNIKNSGSLRLLENLDLLPFIDRDLTNWQIYGENYLLRPCTYILSGRGCGGTGKEPGACTFCVWQHTFWQRKARLRSPKNVVSEIKLLVEKYKVKEIFDDNESSGIWDQNWLKEFSQRMEKEGLVGQVFLSANARADSLDSKRCKILQKTGFRLLKVGLESGNEQTLKRINKKESLEQIKAGVKRAKDYGLVIMLTTMVGYPWESEKDVLKTFQIAKELMLYKTRAGDSLQSSILVPYPGTPLYEQALKEKWFTIDPKDYQKFDMERPVLKTKINPGFWCKKMWQIHLSPKFLAKSLVTIHSLDELRLLLRGAKSLLGHQRDYT